MSVRVAAQPLRYGYGLVSVGPLTPAEVVREASSRESALRERVRQADENARAATADASFWRRCFTETIDHLGPRR